MNDTLKTQTGESDTGDFSATLKYSVHIRNEKYDEIKTAFARDGYHALDEYLYGDERVCVFSTVPGNDLYIYLHNAISFGNIVSYEVERREEAASSPPTDPTNET